MVNHVVIWGQVQLLYCEEVLCKVIWYNVTRSEVICVIQHDGIKHGMMWWCAT